MFVKRLSSLNDIYPDLFEANKKVCFIYPQHVTDLDHFDSKNTVVLTDDIRMYSTLSRAGYNCLTEINDNVDISIILLPKSKELARELIIIGLEKAKGGHVVIDGDKKDGIISITKELEKKFSFDIKLSKAHGKILAFRTDQALLPPTWHSRKVNKINSVFFM